MFEENRYLCEIFGEIVEEVINNKRNSDPFTNSEESKQGLKQLLNNYNSKLKSSESEVINNEIIDSILPNQEELLKYNKSNESNLSNDSELREKSLKICRKNIKDFKREVEDLYQIDIHYCSTARSIRKLFLKKQNFSEREIDFSDELNCLICIYNIFEFYDKESDFYTIRDGCTKLVKEKMESVKILEKKNTILNLLLKCVENLSIDQKLKEKARKMIANTAKYIRAYFFIQEKKDIENIIQSLKFRLNNMIELENHEILDKLMPDETLPDDYQEENLKSEQLVLAKSEIRNIARNFRDSVLDYFEEPQFNLNVTSVNSNSTNCIIDKIDVKLNDLSPVQKYDISKEISIQPKGENSSKQKRANRFIKFINNIFCLCFND